MKSANVSKEKIGSLITLSALTWQEFAALLGVSEMTLSRWTRGRNAPDAEHAAALAAMWDCVMGLDEAARRAFYQALAEARDPVALWREKLGL